MIIVTHIDQLFDPAVLSALPQLLKTEFAYQLANAARQKWSKLAQEGLATTRMAYLDGLQPVELEDGTATIALLGVLPNIIENGMPAVDLHDTLLGPNVPVAPRGQRGKHKKKKGGFYRFIPFRHATPGTAGAVGVAMGSQYEGHSELGGMGFRDSAALGQSVYKAAKALSGTTQPPGGGKMAWGSRLPAGLAPKLKPGHATDIYAGMYRVRQTYAKATQSQYVTFRTISTGSPGWLRGATAGKHYVSQVNQHIMGLAPKALGAFLASKGIQVQ